MLMLLSALTQSSSCFCRCESEFMLICHHAKVSIHMILAGGNPGINITVMQGNVIIPCGTSLFFARVKSSGSAILKAMTDFKV